MNHLIPSATPPLDDAQADAIARSLHRTAVAWAHTFLKSRAGLDPTLAEALAAETLAFGLALLADRLRGLGPPVDPFLAKVRHAAWGRHAQWRAGGQPARIGLRGAAEAEGEPKDVSRFTVACRSRGSGGQASFEFTEPMHAEFCALTGLGSSELVGRGPNFAALMFYLVVHGRVFASRPDSREERRWLIQCLRECREFLERALEFWLNAAGPARRPASAAIGR